MTLDHCPFCGAGAEIVVHHGLRRVQCCSCKASTHNYLTEEEAADMWNLRDRRSAVPDAWRVSHGGEWHYFPTREQAARERQEYEAYEATRADGDREHQEPQPVFV